MSADGAAAPSALPAGLEPLDNQVAGHVFAYTATTEAGGGSFSSGVLRDRATGHILKPLQAPPRGRRELEFYQTVAVYQHGRPNAEDDQMVALAEFVPKFHGERSFQMGDTECSFIEMDDVTGRFRCPCVLDVKIGAVTYDRDATDRKKAYEMRKYPLAKLTGFRLLGMNVRSTPSGDRLVRDKHWGKALRQHELLPALQLYVSKLPTVAAMCRVLDAFVAKGRRLAQWARAQQRYEFVSSSLLLVYDAAEPHETELCMIDFSHTFPCNANDTNYSHGLRSFLQYLTDTRLLVTS